MKKTFIQQLLVVVALLMANTNLGAQNTLELWGVTGIGGANNTGTLGHYSPSTSTWTTDYSFSYGDVIDNYFGSGVHPSTLTYARGKFYGTTITGGANGKGEIFEWDPYTKVYTKKYDFSYSAGEFPMGQLVYVNGKFYGMTESGGFVPGNQGGGVIFEWDPATNIYTMKTLLTSGGGSAPFGSLSYLDGKFYGMTSNGGANGVGMIFEWNPVTNIVTNKFDFDGANGSYPHGSLAYGGGKFCGMTNAGGAVNSGVLFEWDPSTNTFMKEMDFTIDTGVGPGSSLAFSNGKFYGLTNARGGGQGVLFEWDPSIKVYTKEVIFLTSANGTSPTGALTFSAGKFYGMTSAGGANGLGVVFEWSPVTNIYSKKVDLSVETGRSRSETQFALIKEEFSQSISFSILPVKTFGDVPFNLTATASSGLPVTYKSSNPLVATINGSMVTIVGVGETIITASQAGNENYLPASDVNQILKVNNAPSQPKLIGLAAEGGAYNGGTMFQINTDGTGLTTLYNFQSSTGSFPISSLIQAQDNLLYGVSKSGGSSGFGTIFRIEPNGSNHVVLFNFTNETGYPVGSLLQMPDGVLFGMTTHSDAGFGTAYSINPNGSNYTERYRFPAENGLHQPGFLMRASNGVIYGTSYTGGAYQYGQVFRMNPDGSEPLVLQHFSWEDVDSPYGALFQANDGALYGVGNQGGNLGAGSIYRVLPDASVVSMIHYFDLSEGGYPAGSLVQAPDGALYGMTTEGGPNNFGSLYKINPDKSGFSVLQYFDGHNGKGPIGNLVYYDNKLYGYTTTGGLYENGSQSGYGVLFNYDLATGIYTKLVDLGGASGEHPMFGSLLLLNPESAVAPTAAASGIGLTKMKSHSMTLSFSQGNGMDHLVVMKTGSAPTFRPENNKLYFGDLSDGTTVVYNGKNTTLDVTGLAPSSQQFFTVFEYNTNYAGNVRYQTGGAPVASQRTLSYSEAATKMVGVTRAEGRSDAGTMFSINPDGTDFTVLYNFSSTAGHQIGTLFTAKDTYLYGVSKSGGTHAFGSLYKIKSDGTGYAVIYNFTRDDGFPAGSPLQTEDGTLFGVSTHDEAQYGTVYKMNPDGSGHVELYRFTMATGYRQPGHIMQASNGFLYVTTYAGGYNGFGLLVRMNSDGSEPVVIREFTGEDGIFPYSALTETTDGRLYGVAHLGGEGGSGLLYRIEADGSEFTVVHNFNGGDGGYPSGAVTQTPEGVLYGVTIVGGQFGLGTLYKINPDGTGFEVLQNFNGENGNAPLGDLTLYDKKLYGYTAAGGLYAGGTLFYYDPETATHHKLTDLNAAMGVGPAFGSLLPVPLRQLVTGVQNFSVVDLRTDKKLKDFDRVISLDVGDPHFGDWTIRANTYPNEVGSVVFKIDNLKKNTENKVPYLLERHYLRSLIRTQHILEAEAYSNHDGRGTKLQSRVAQIGFVNKTEAMHFEVLNASGEKVRNLNDGDTVNMQDLRFRKLKIAVILNRATDNGSVQFYLNGQIYQNENKAPYILATSNRKWWSEPGLYTVAAIPFSGRNANGVPGTPVTVSFFISVKAPCRNIIAKQTNVSDSVDIPKTHVIIYPVPALRDLSILSEDYIHDESAHVILWDMFGKVHLDKIVQLTKEPYSLDLEQLGLHQGIYFIRIGTDNTTDVFRFVKE